ncbi:MAG: tRNA (adenosine(37)-N6)-threonylcarbamoyltransferase complex dimerization subunit type 1 TsaB [Desulfuromonadaceae bacterium]|nr:tRNA (adenosine(37)-N6)-threonylcarbamoyltransferase complex dimerization subunit type 1 TsaB [Desulfuromonadaceae bacterium]
METLWLSIDSSTPRGSVAVVCGTELVAEVCLQVKARTHSDYLLRYAEFLLSEVGATVSQVEKLCVVEGPGSFTGLRVGLATVQGLAQRLDCPVYTVSSLQVMAYLHGPVAGPVFPLLDARKKELYGARYDWVEGVPRCSGLPFVLPPETIASLLPDGALVLGDAAVSNRDCLDGVVAGRLLFGGVASGVPSSGGAALLVARHLDHFPALTAKSLRPLYVRASDAELQKSRLK